MEINSSDVEDKSLNDEIEEKLPPANILVAGITGVGKSTLVNAIFGQKLAAVGSGKPVTEKIDEYYDDKNLIHIYDTVGLELDSIKTKDSIKDITNVIRKKAENSDTYDRIHAIWYCINSASNRYQGEELNFIKELHSLGVPFVIVLTKCSGEENEINAFQDKINEINEHNGMKDISIVQVMAVAMKFRGGGEVPAFGLKELVNLTLNKLPAFLIQGFIAAQRVDQKEKRKACERIIEGYIKESKEDTLSKIPIANAFYTDSKLKKMLTRMGNMYNTRIDNEHMDNLLEQFNLAGGKFKSVVDVRQGVKGLLNPFTTKFQRNLDLYFEDLISKGFSLNIHEIPLAKDNKVLSPKENTIRMTVYFGYIFLQAIETVWNALDEKDLDDIEKVANKLKVEINKQFKDFNQNLNSEMDGE